MTEYPTLKQRKYAKILARAGGVSVPAECYKDKRLMSEWIEKTKIDQLPDWAKTVPAARGLPPAGIFEHE